MKKVKETGKGNFNLILFDLVYPKYYHFNV